MCLLDTIAKLMMQIVCFFNYLLCMCSILFFILFGHEQEVYVMMENVLGSRWCFSANAIMIKYCLVNFIRVEEDNNKKGSSHEKGVKSSINLAQAQNVHMLGHYLFFP